MAARPSWEGHLRLSLVTCPVALWPATSEAETIRFNMINPRTNNRIRMQTVDAGTGEQVARSELVKGFQVAKGEYVLFDKKELDAVKLESTRIIDIEKFVPRASIDRLYWEMPYLPFHVFFGVADSAFGAGNHRPAHRKPEIIPTDRGSVFGSYYFLTGPGRSSPTPVRCPNVA
jgi:hypothetical protein